MTAFTAPLGEVARIQCRDEASPVLIASEQVWAKSRHKAVEILARKMQIVDAEDAVHDAVLELLVSPPVSGVPLEAALIRAGRFAAYRIFRRGASPWSENWLMAYLNWRSRSSEPFEDEIRHRIESALYAIWNRGAALARERSRARNPKRREYRRQHPDAAKRERQVRDERRRQVWRESSAKTCEDCGTVFKADFGRAWSTQKYCSRKCGARARVKAYRARLRAEPMMTARIGDGE